MPVIQTERLVLRELTFADAEFIVELLNDPDFLRYIGNKGVRNAEDARRYIETGPLDSYARHGFGLYLVESKAAREPMGMCGLVKRKGLEQMDLGFAFLPRFRSRGYAHEAATAALLQARRDFGVGRVLAITSQDNEASIALLTRLGFRFENLVRLADGEPIVKLFALDAPCDSPAEAR